tara:strand:+ start:8430 stop:8942 length:513 start_codon:yes stop_codon:yes gene_type:complete
MLKTINDINNAILNVDKSLLNMDTLLIDDNNTNNNIKMKDIRALKQNILDIQIAINVYEHKNKNANLNQQRTELNKVINNMKVLNDYNSLLLEHYETNLLNTISLINLIFLPLAVITGYFGMNFIHMGPFKNAKKGIYTFKNPNIFVGTLMVVSTIIMMLTYYILNMYKN